MYFAVSLVLALLFALGLHRTISKHALIWYGIAVAFVIFEWFYYALGWRTAFPEWFTMYFINFFKRNAFPSALFVLVMFTSVLRSDWNITKKLRKNRGKLSIIASILTLGHNLVYGKTHFVKLFTDPGSMKAQYIIASVISLIMIAIMIPLMITSFQCVRKRMRAISWKRLQRWAYVFYALLYAHVIVLFVPKFNQKIFDIILYTVVFGGYLLLKLYKTNALKAVKK